MLTERNADNPGYAPAGTPFPGLDAVRLHWPAPQRPPGAALHAKIVVVDDRVALVGSANLTSRAMEANLECGILIRGGPHPAPSAITSSGSGRSASSDLFDPQLLKLPETSFYHSTDLNYLFYF